LPLTPQRVLEALLQKEETAGGMVRPRTAGGPP
jgi:hypothetical protein